MSKEDNNMAREAKGRLNKDTNLDLYINSRPRGQALNY